MASNLNLIAMASNLEAMASNLLVEMTSNLLAMAYTESAFLLFPQHDP